MAKRLAVLALCLFSTIWSEASFAQQMFRGFRVREKNGSMVCETAVDMKVQPEALASLHVINPHVNAAGLTIILRGTSQMDAYPAAKAAFSRAAATWEQYLTTPVTINIDVDFGPTRFGTAYPSADILGSTNSQLSVTTYSTVNTALLSSASLQYQQNLYKALPSVSVPTDLGPTTTVVIPQPEMRVLGLMSAVPSASDKTPNIGFNSAFSWDFDNSDGVSSNQTDFESVALHEIGHALGFSSLVGFTELDSTLSPAVSVLDLFRFRPGGGANFGNSNRILSSGGDQIFWNGSWEDPLSTGRPDGSGGDGQQASHWKEWRTTGYYVGVMNPTLARGTTSFITVDDMLAFNLLGYSISVPAAPAAPSNLTATANGTQITLHWQDNSSNENEFRLEASANGAAYGEIIGLRANSTSAVLVNFAPSTTYKFRLFAANAGGISPYSNEATTTTGSGGTPPPTGPCIANSTTACVLSNRFRVTVRYRGGFDNNAVDADALVKVVPGFAGADSETVFFYFNSPSNLELMAKLLDQGSTNAAGQRTVAVLYGVATPLRIELTVTDTTNGATKTYKSDFLSQTGQTDFTAFIK